MKKSQKISLSKVFFWIVMVAFVWYLIGHFGQAKEILQVLSTGKWYWIALAIITQICYYPIYSIFADHIFQIFNVNFTPKKILPIFMASKFTDVALPISTFGMIAIFVRHAKGHDESPLRVGIGTSFVLIFEVLAFITVTTVVLALLYFTGHPIAYALVTFLFLVVVITLLVIFVIRVAIYKKAPNKLFLWIVKVLSRMAGQKHVDMKEIESIFMEIGADISANKQKIWPGYRFSLLAQLFNVLTFLFVFLAFTGNLNIMAVLAGYAIGLLFTVVSITPQGIGPAEAAIIATLHSFGLDISQSAVITLAFRGLLYWLPVFPGFWAFQRLEFAQKSSAK